MPDPLRRIGVLAGGGTLPLEFARSAASRGELAHVVALEGAAETDFAGLPVTRIGMGQVGRMLAAFRAHDVREIVIIGPAPRPDLTRLKVDLGFFRHLPAILSILAAGGDDGVLSAVVRFFEGQGFRVIGPAGVAPETLAPEGPIGAVAIPASAVRDIALGFEVIRRLGDLDVGQAVVVAGGRIAAIEGAEGTDRMLVRLAESSVACRGGVLVKRPKPGQELRVDMPSIGPGSVTRASEAGLAGIAVHAGDVLVAERSEVARRADRAGLFVAGVTDGVAQTSTHSKAQAHPVQPIGRHAPGRYDLTDIAIGAEVSARAALSGCGRVVVVARGHVLAVEAGGEGAGPVLERVARYRNRHGRMPKRSGVALLAPGEALDGAVLAFAAAARLAGIAVSSPRGGFPDPALVTACDDGHMFIVAIDAPYRTPSGENRE